jgi:ribosome biogenesis GTPase A
MNTLYIAHNPFTVDTEILVNNIPPADNCKLKNYSERRLQQWVEKLFDDLKVIFNDDQHYHITFKGVESDYLDVAAAAQQARSAGAEVELVWEEVLPADHRLELIRKLWDDVVAHPEIGRHVSEDDGHTMEDAYDRNFDVYVVATMSAGKSTLINAMLGTTLLPAANEATTASIVRITDNDQMTDGFRGQRINEAGELLDETENVTAPLLKEWNLATDTFRINLEGNIKAIRETEQVRLVLTDTPGPNNSQNEEHRLITMRQIKNTARNPLILYLLNGTQLGVDDDKFLLKQIAETMATGGKQSKDRFVFVVNKMDDFDPEKESIPGALERVRIYLESNGIKEPVVHPVSAEFARLLRMANTDLTKKELQALNGFVELIDEIPAANLNQYIPVTDLVKRNLASKNLHPREIATGLPAVEAMIEEYIGKYNVPHRIKRAHDALKGVLDRALNEAELIESLNRDEAELEKIRDEIARLEEKKEKGFDVRAFKERLKEDRKDLPQETVEKLKNLRQEIGEKLRNYGSRFNGGVSRSDAKRLVDQVKNDLRTLYEISILDLETINAEMEQYLKETLKGEYQAFVKNMFSDIDELDFPALEKLQNCMKDFSGNIELDIQEEHVKRRTRSTSVWYKPWTWGDEVVSERVDLTDFWKSSSAEIDPLFRTLLNAAISEMQDRHSGLVDRMLQFMNEQFEPRFDELLATVKAKTAAGQSKVADLAYTRHLLAEIQGVNQRLRAIIALETDHA